MKYSLFIETAFTVVATIIFVLIVQYEWSLYQQLKYLDYQASDKIEVLPTISFQCKNGLIFYRFWGGTIDPKGDQTFSQKDIDRACGN